MKNIIKLAGIEFTEEELKHAFFEKAQHFIVKYRSIYKLNYSKNAGFSAREIYKKREDGSVPLIRRGRFIFSNADFCNKLIDQELFTD